MEKYKIKNIWEKIKTNYSKISDNSWNIINIETINKKISTEDKIKLKEKIKKILQQKNKNNTNENSF
jgi:hypothetical protein